MRLMGSVHSPVSDSDLGKEAGEGCRGSPPYAFTLSSKSQAWAFLYTSGDSADNVIESQNGLGLGWKGSLKSLFKYCLCLFCIHCALAKKAFLKRLHRI